MPSQKQRRDAARRHLERQLKARADREARRKRVTLITSIVGTLVLIAVIVIVVTVATGGSDKKKPNAGSSKSAKPATSTSAATTPCGQEQFATKPVHNAAGKAVSFDGVTVKGATDLTGKPVVTAHNTKAAPKLVVKDLVVGKGTAATPSSCVTVQYDGVYFKNGKEFDSSWKRKTLAQFSLTGVVPGFTQGIGGTTGVAPMKVGGRRLIVVPYTLGYGAAGGNGIPAKADLVFIVDLVKVSSATA